MARRDGSAFALKDGGKSQCSADKYRADFTLLDGEGAGAGATAGAASASDENAPAAGMSPRASVLQRGDDVDALFGICPSGTSEKAAGEAAATTAVTDDDGREAVQPAPLPLQEIRLNDAPERPTQRRHMSLGGLKRRKVPTTARQRMELAEAVKLWQKPNFATANTAGGILIQGRLPFVRHVAVEVEAGGKSVVVRVEPDLDRLCPTDHSVMDGMGVYVHIDLAVLGKRHVSPDDVVASWNEATQSLRVFAKAMHLRQDQKAGFLARLRGMLKKAT